MPIAGGAALWSEAWQSAIDRLETIEGAIEKAGASVARGGDFDSWDLAVRGGLLGEARLRLVVEEHGSGKQLARFHWAPRVAPGTVVAILALGAGAALASTGGALGAAIVLGAMAVGLGARTLVECGQAVAAVAGAVGVPATGPESHPIPSPARKLPRTRRASRRATAISRAARDCRS
jgi:hypothetical protein